MTSQFFFGSRWNPPVGVVYSKFNYNVLSDQCSVDESVFDESVVSQNEHTHRPVWSVRRLEGFDSPVNSHREAAGHVVGVIGLLEGSFVGNVEEDEVEADHVDDVAEHHDGVPPKLDGVLAENSEEGTTCSDNFVFDTFVLNTFCFKWVAINVFQCFNCSRVNFSVALSVPIIKLVPNFISSHANLSWRVVNQSIYIFAYLKFCILYNAP